MAMVRPPGRPRSFAPDTVLDGAMELFWRNGYAGTTTRQLEARLGITQSSIYNTFGSKRALLDHALDRYETLVQDELVAPLRAGGGPAAVERFVRAVGGWITDGAHPGCLLVNLMSEDGGSEPALTARTAAYRQALRDALGRALADESRAELVLAAVLGLNVAARGGASSREIAATTGAICAQVRSWT